MVRLLKPCRIRGRAGGQLHTLSGNQCQWEITHRGCTATAMSVSDPTAPEQVSQAPGLRELRLAESEQILPPIGNRKPASDRAHCPSESNPVTGTAHRQEDRGARLQNRGDSTTACGQLHARSRNSIWKFPLEQGWICSERLSKSARQIPACSHLSQEPKPTGDLARQIHRSRAGLARTWTTRAQARRVRADPTAGRKPKACK